MDIIWRNTPRGHLSTKENFYSAPLSQEEVDDIVIIDDVYNWDKFHEQNILIHK